MLDLLAKKGSKEILTTLEESSKRFTELLNSLEPRITRRTLARRLRELEDLGLIKRELPEKPPGVLYLLTEKGKERTKLISELEK